MEHEPEVCRDLLGGQYVSLSSVSIILVTLQQTAYGVMAMY
jgi:hypothetical protein